MAEANLLIKIMADAKQALGEIGALGKELKHIDGLSAAAKTIGTGMSVAGGAISAALGEMTHVAADFEAAMTRVRNNTTMTTADAELMRATVLKLGGEAPVALDKLADGFMHITNFGFSAKDSVQILEAAMKSAVSTGGDTAATAEVLAAAMHEFGIDASKAAETMDMLHTAAAEGNMTLEQFSSSFGQVAAWAAAVGVPLDQAAAAMSAMTRHGFSASEAATQVKDQIEHLIKPSEGAKKALKELGNTIGEDLSGVMTSTELHSKGLVGVLDELHAAMDKAGLSADEQVTMWMRLVPNIRGGAASFVLAGRGAEDFASILSDLHSKLGVTDEAFDRMKSTANFQWGVFTNQVQELAIAVGTVLLPRMIHMAQIAQQIVKVFMDLPEPMQQTIVLGAALAGTILTIGGVLLLAVPPILAFFGAIGSVAGAIAGIAAITEIWAALQLVIGAAMTGELLPALGLLVAALGGPLALAIGAVVGAMALLAVAWANDWGNIREIVGPAIDGIVAAWNGSLLPALQAFGSFMGTYVLPLFAALVGLFLAPAVRAVHLFADAWTSVLQPALQATGAAIYNFMIKPFVDMFELFKNIVAAMASNPVTANLPGVQGLKDFVNAVPTNLTQATAAINATSATIRGDAPPPVQVTINQTNNGVDATTVDQVADATHSATLDALIGAFNTGAPAVPAGAGGAF